MSTYTKLLQDAERTKLEDALEFQIRAHGLYGYQKEYRFDADRKWRADFAWPSKRLLVEVEGGLYSQGRHVRGKGYEADLEKYNAAVSQGWAVLRFSAKHIRDATAIDAITRYLKRSSKEKDGPVRTEFRISWEGEA